MARSETRTNRSRFLDKRDSFEILRRERTNFYIFLETSPAPCIPDKMIRKRKKLERNGIIISRARIIKRSGRNDT